MNTPYNLLLERTVAGLTASLFKHMPDCAYREFYVWALSTDNPHRDIWLDVVGLRQTTRLTLDLLGNVVSDNDWEQLRTASVGMNVYLTYEVASDQLAVGLATQGMNDRTFTTRRELLRIFNHAMTAKLGSSAVPAARLLEPARQLARQISTVDISLNPHAYVQIAHEYQVRQGKALQPEWEYEHWPLLVANMEACYAIARSVSMFRVGDLIQQGLANRYRAVSTLLENDDIVLPRRAHVGADAVLAMPVLAYYIGVLAEKVWKLDVFGEILEDGTFSETIHAASLAVRLLNDLGTIVIMQDYQRREMLTDLKVQFVDSKDTNTPQTLTELLFNVRGKYTPLLTRLRKDISHGEFNVCLYGFSDSLPVIYNLENFGQRLEYLSNLYTQSYTRLQINLDSISKRLHDDRISQLVSRFVYFHRLLYAPVESLLIGAS